MFYVAGDTEIPVAVQLLSELVIVRRERQGGAFLNGDRDHWGLGRDERELPIFLNSRAD